MKIYEPVDKNKVGPNPDQYRDCIDIAVKLAFGLNKLKDVINVKTITSLDIIKEVTNNPDIMSQIPYLENGTLRIKQASNDDIRKAFDKILKNIDSRLDSFSKFDAKAKSSEVLKKIKLVYQEKINADCKTSEYKEFIQDLVSFTHDNIQKEFVDYIGNSQIIDESI
jgi:hypothetical protein